MVTRKVCGMLSALLLLAVDMAAEAEVSVQPDAAPVSLGKLEPFWRYSATLGPFLESGYSLVEIPDYLLQGDFPYKKRPYPKEVPFADHLSVVRLLGGYSSGKGQAGKPMPERDLAYRNKDGKICYRMELLKPRLQPYLDCGYSNLTLVLDDIPWCFPEKARAGQFGQAVPPARPEEWYGFVKALCEELVKIMGADGAQKLRFRVGTENNGRERFDGTQSEFFAHYDNAARAVKEVIPGAKFGGFNISSVSLKAVQHLHNVNALTLAEHCMVLNVPFDWVAYSRYYRPGDEPEYHVRNCREVWDEFGKRMSQFKSVSREIHEFGVAPFGEVAKGQFTSAEPGALGAALTCQMMWELREAGINRLWHWPAYDHFRGRKSGLKPLFTGEAWLLCVMDQMAGGEAYLFPAIDKSPAGTKHVIAASFKDGGALFMVSSYNADIACHSNEVVRFSVPAEFLRLEGKKVCFAELTRATAVHDCIRRDFDRAGLLEDAFVSRPDRLGSVREMGKGREAETFVGDHWDELTKQWIDSLTLKPLNAAVGKIESTKQGVVFSLSLTVPEVLVLSVR